MIIKSMNQPIPSKRGSEDKSLRQLSYPHRTYALPDIRRKAERKRQPFVLCVPGGNTVWGGGGGDLYSYSRYSEHCRSEPAALIAVAVLNCITAGRTGGEKYSVEQLGQCFFFAPAFTPQTGQKGVLNSLPQFSQILEKSVEPHF